ncbi:hypothetical protein MSMEI_0954 [Mycolicibacterium smegmatis MC2 155]|uniref:Uncharacterized protein n=1 Tax=Mycolicibacterium smegmatis (strain ATCC 700084 / mc(2)155) TaxID=246196 RepID=I7G4I4_MYCS2|nr:hypothetical protein MSMEI_0954 [Mycolicibacterium smegmatis MC2 155]
MIGDPTEFDEQASDGGEQVLDCGHRQRELRYEPDSGARRDHLREVLLVVRRDQDHRGWPRLKIAEKFLGELKPALGAQRDVHQDHIGLQFAAEHHRLGTVGGDADYLDPATVEHRGGSRAKTRTVIDDETTHHASTDRSCIQGGSDRSGCALLLAGICRYPWHDRGMTEP